MPIAKGKYSKGMWLVGAMGIGKTHLMGAFTNRPQLQKLSSIPEHESIIKTVMKKVSSIA